MEILIWVGVHLTIIISEITGYLLEYSNNNFVTQENINLGVVNQTQITGITEIGEYIFRIYAVNGKGYQGGWSGNTQNNGYGKRRMRLCR